MSSALSNPVSRLAASADRENVNAGQTPLSRSFGEQLQHAKQWQFLEEGAAIPGIDAGRGKPDDSASSSTPPPGIVAQRGRIFPSCVGKLTLWRLVWRHRDVRLVHALGDSDWDVGVLAAGTAHTQCHDCRCAVSEWRAGDRLHRRWNARVFAAQLFPDDACSRC
jgi:hypothetical protein